MLKTFESFMIFAFVVVSNRENTILQHIGLIVWFISKYTLLLKIGRVCKYVFWVSCRMIRNGGTNQYVGF